MLDLGLTILSVVFILYGMALIIVGSEYCYWRRVYRYKCGYYFRGSSPLNPGIYPCPGCGEVDDNWKLRIGKGKWYAPWSFEWKDDK